MFGGAGERQILLGQALVITIDLGLMAAYESDQGAAGGDDQVMAECRCR